MVNIWNKTAKEVTEIVNGIEFIFPPNGCLSVTEKKAEKLLKLRGDELSSRKPGEYTEAQIAGVANLNKQEAVTILQALMRGETVKPELMQALTEERKNGKTEEAKQPELAQAKK